MQTVKVKDVEIGSGRLAVLAGPCVAESKELCLEIAGRMKEICRKLDLGYIFKASFDKANRSSIDSYRGPGLERGLEILEAVKQEFDLPVVTDIHESWQADDVAKRRICSRFRRSCAGRPIC